MMESALTQAISGYLGRKSDVDKKIAVSKMKFFTVNVYVSLRIFFK